MPSVVKYGSFDTINLYDSYFKYTVRYLNILVLKLGQIPVHAEIKVGKVTPCWSKVTPDDGIPANSEQNLFKLFRIKALR